MKQLIEKVRAIDWAHVRREARLYALCFRSHKKIMETIQEEVYRPPEIVDVWEQCPIAFTNPEQNLILTRDNIQSRFYLLQGVNYESISFEQICQKHEALQGFFEQLPHDLGITIFSRRFLKKAPKSSVTETSCSTINQALIDCWDQSFEETHENQFVLMVQTMKQPKDLKDDDEWNEFELVTNAFEQKLDFLGAKSLIGDELASFMCSLLKMDPLAKWKMPEDGDLESRFPGSMIEFREDGTFRSRINQTEYYSSCLVANTASASKKFAGRPFEILFSQPREFCMVQQFHRMEKETVFQKQLSKLRTAALGSKYKKISEGKLEDTLERIEADELNVFGVSTAIHLMETSEKRLLESEAQMLGLLSNAHLDFVFSRENLIPAEVYWSMWPGHSHMNPRKHMMSAEEVPYMIAVPSASTGEVSTPWGNQPLTTFKTARGGHFGFSLHNSSSEGSNGNTLIVGGTGMGKTTLISFLISNAMRIPDLKSVAFDHFSGMKIPTLLQDGNYIAFDERRSEINPFHLEGTDSDKKFLLRWLIELAGPATPEEIADLEIFIEVMFRFPKETRGFMSFLDKLDDNGPGTFASKLKKWNSDNFYGGYFQGKRDCLDFSNRRLAFDMEKIVSQDEVLSAMCSYIFHRIEKLQIEAPSPGILFFDEASIYLSNDLLGQKALDALRTYRKRNWAVILACQSLGDIANLKIGNAALSNIETFLFYPEPSAQYDIYHQVAGLTKTEFEWIRGYARRQVMLKRRGGESVILDVDLSPLGKHLRVFDSNAKAIFDYDHAGKDEPNEDYGDHFNLPERLDFVVQLPKYLHQFAGEDLGYGAAMVMHNGCLPEICLRKEKRSDLSSKRISIQSAKSVRHFRKLEEKMSSRRRAATAAMGYFWQEAFEAGRVSLDLDFTS